MTHSILDLLRSAVVSYGYWAVGLALLAENAGVPVPGETILLLASFLAYSEHDLRLPWIIVVATIAATLGDNLGFALEYFFSAPRPLSVCLQNPFPDSRARRRSIQAVRRRHNLICPVLVRVANHRGADGGSSTDALAEIHGLELHWCCVVGDRDFRSGLLLRTALAAFGTGCQAT